MINFKFLIISVLILFSFVKCEDVVDFWNNVALDILKSTPINPPKNARSLAMVYIGMFDAANSINQTYECYGECFKPLIKPSFTATVSGAAHYLLSYLYPERKVTFDLKLEKILSNIFNSKKKNEGLKLGREVAELIMRMRSNDLSYSFVEYPKYEKCSDWNPLPHQRFLGLEYSHTIPWTLLSPDQFRSPPPPKMGSHEWIRQYDRVKLLGGKKSNNRTTDQTEIALFWEDGAGTVTPVGTYIRIAAKIANLKNLSPFEKLRLLTLINVAQSDSAIAAWETKYYYNSLRPLTAIQDKNKCSEGNWETDESWIALLPTPIFPDHVSGHAVFGAAATRIIQLFFGTDDITFSIDSDGYKGVIRRYTKISETAYENGISRIYGGVHFDSANEEGQKLGIKVAEWVMKEIYKQYHNNDY